MKKTYFLFSLIGFLGVLFLTSCGGADLDPGRLAHADEPGVDAGGLIVPEIKNDAITAGSTSGKKPVIAVDAYFASNGSTITVPTGFTVAQCKFTASVANVDANSISTRVTISNTGVVTCLKTVQEREEIPPTTVGCVASYTIICIKEVDQ
ncbi:MAG: hypothetical protein IPJ69_14620 [Deltaproteobacteria bacterium]|nr:MAG: hypothetical protein IPJ69_14620 [Deltaproteobacteria bacterium]